MYYLIKCPYGINGENPAQLTYKKDDPRRSWISGVKYSTDPNTLPFLKEPPTPIEFSISEEDKGAMKEMWEAPALVMTKKLAEALRNAGVANLDEYEAVITDVNSGQTHTDYVAVNVVGIVAATDEANSEYDPDIRFFDKLKLDESAARETLLFRLKDAKYKIFVHEKVKENLENAGFDSLRFLDPDRQPKQVDR